MSVSVTCPACGSPGQAPAGAGGFRCKACQRDVWIIGCHRCQHPTAIFGSATGSGALEFRCSNCRRRNFVQKQALRAINAEVRRLERAEVAARRESAAREKAAKAQQTETRQEEVVRRNQELRTQMDGLQTVLVSSLSEPPFTFDALRIEAEKPSFDPGDLGDSGEAPQLASFMPPQVTGLAAMVPGAMRKQRERNQAAERAFEQAEKEYQQREDERFAALARARAAWESEIAAIEDAARRQQAGVDDLERRFQAGDPDAVIRYFGAAFVSMSLPYHPPAEPRVAYSAESRQLVVELELPAIDVVPEVREYRYVKTRDEITTAAMPATERRRTYASLVAQTALRALHFAFNADPYGTVETVVMNGHVQTVDKRTGQSINPCLVTVRATREHVGQLNLAQVDPAECLKGLNASLSRSPAELVPVRPVIEFDMADPRFVHEQDVLSTLDTRPNLMDLTPKEFESLITNLFEKMGLETRLTQPSRDGGVDCVAYDARPIFGGKVVIQAKRYKNTVGVSAVRDLFGTMQNEGASKGILVTTSGYGQASHEFANGKPLELIDGGNLLYLLHEHADIDAKIEVPEDWIDPQPDSPLFGEQPETSAPSPQAPTSIVPVRMASPGGPSSLAESPSPPLLSDQGTTTSPSSEAIRGE